MAADTKAPLENLAEQRVQHLIPYIATALGFGCLDPEAGSESLKVMILE